MPSVNFRWVRRYQTPIGIPAGVPRPMLSVHFIQANTVSSEILALVDSGADVSMFHVDVAQYAGIDLGQCQTIPVRGVGGIVTAYSCPIEVQIEGRRFSIDAHFVPQMVALLGRHDVFTHFRFAFDQRAQELLIEPYDS